MTAATPIEGRQSAGKPNAAVVTGLLATTRRLLPGGRHVFVPLNAIERIDRREKKIYVTPTRDEVRRGSRRMSRCG